MKPHHGYSLREKPARNHKLLHRDQHISVIAAMSAQGMLDCKITVNGEVIYKCLLSNLVPHLQRFDGYNTLSVVILDNASIHHTDSAVKAIEETSALVHFLPPYSPDLSPLKEAFSKVKTRMKHLEETTKKDIETLITAAFAEITENGYKSWINDSKVYKHI